MNDAPDKILIYPAKDGRPAVRLRVEDGAVWLTQAEIAGLFATTAANVNIHIKNILREGELMPGAVIKESLIPAADGKNYRTKLHRLELVLHVGYRVKGPRGVQFRQWATAHLGEFLVKGFVMDDERLKNPGGFDYFDELLARIRDIRASEKRFYQKVRDLFALSSDYNDDPDAAGRFFAETQNRMLFAVTRRTAAEIIVDRADPAAPNMALQAWSGSVVRKHDVIVAKNYLTHDEIDTLNRIVVLFLEQAELRVKGGKTLTLDFWRTNLERMLEFSDFPLLKGAGSIGHDRMKSIVEKRYEQFDAHRRAADALTADAEDVRALQDLEAVEKLVKPKRAPLSQTSDAGASPVRPKPAKAAVGKKPSTKKAEGGK